MPHNHLFYSLGAPNLVRLTGQTIVFTIEKYFDGIRYLDISPKNSGCGYNISIYRILLYRMIWDMISRYTSRYDITPDYLATPGKYIFNENPPPRFGLLLFFSALSLPSSLLVLRPALSSSFCYPSAGHIIGLTVPPAKSNLVPPGLGLLPEHLCLLLVHL